MKTDMESNSNNTKEKEYKKFINFGKLYPFESTFFSNEENLVSELKKDIEKKFKSSNTYIIDTMFDSNQNKIIPREEKLTFTKISSAEDYFFGTFIRTSNSKDVLTNIIDNESNKKLDPNTFYFEYNTLFYIDYKNQAISFIKTEHIRNVYPFLEIFLNNNNFLNIKIAPLVKSEEEIKQSVITKVDITCSKVSINPHVDFVEMKNLEKMGCVVKDYKLTVSLKEIKKGFSHHLLNFRDKNKESVKRMSISTLNEDIDLLTNTYTKSVPIKLTNNYEKNYTVIENTLKEELLKAIQG